MAALKNDVSLSRGWDALSNAVRKAVGDPAASWELGTAQHSGALTVIPIFGPQDDAFIAPSAGVRLHHAHTYGDVELQCPATSGTGKGDLAIVPLHMGFIQHGAQNHALCSSALIEPGGSVRMNDACCVQAAQGGLLEGRDQWFFILPLTLRTDAMQLQGIRGYNKLWTSIGRLNRSFGLPERGHLEQLLTKERAYLTQFRSRFECQDGQVGALFLVGKRLVGIEIAPNAAYFQDLWMPLVMFAYGITAYHREKSQSAFYKESPPFAGVETLADLRQRLEESRTETEGALGASLYTAAGGWADVRCSLKSQHAATETSLESIAGESFAGQVVRRAGRAVYLSAFSTKASEISE